MDAESVDQVSAIPRDPQTRAEWERWARSMARAIRDCHHLGMLASLERVTSGHIQRLAQVSRPAHDEIQRRLRQRARHLKPAEPTQPEDTP